MITANSLLLSFKREFASVGLWLLYIVARWTVPLLFVAFVIVDGVVTRNELTWANEPRAWLMICLFGFGLAVMALNRIRFEPAVAILVGVIAAMIVSQSSSDSSRPDITLWVIAAGAFLWQRSIQNDWRPSFARAGMAMAIVVLVVGVGSLCGIPAPVESGAWNQNVTAGTLAVLMPSVITSRKGRSRWIMLAAMAAAIVVTGSRGGILAAMVALIISLRTRRVLRWAAIATPVILIALAWYSFAFKPIQTYERFLFIREALAQWRQTSLAYGVGPGGLWFILPGHRVADVQAHNSIVTIAAMVGIAGAGIIGAALSNVKRVALDNWQLATLAALVVHGLVDDPLTWLPTVLIAAVAAAGCRRECKNSLGSAAV